MYKKILLLHGWGGSNFPHWQSWLAGEIAKDYGCVNFLKFSNFDTPNLEQWSKELLYTLEDFKPDIVICHSLANTLWFHLANKKLLSSVKTLYLVAPPSLQCDIPELRQFFPVEVPKNLYAEKTTFIYSNNDPYMSETEALELQKHLHVETLRLEKAGHINSDSNFGKWEWILNNIKSDVKKSR